MKQAGKTGWPVAWGAPEDVTTVHLDRLDSESIWGPLPSGTGKCAHSHKPLVIPGPKGEQYKVHGGSAYTPLKEDHGVYVSLDSADGFIPLAAYPWNGDVRFVHFPIKDMHAPKDPVEFKKMIEWLAQQIREGVSVHVGCIGGHGRTGMVLAALTSVLGGLPDAIAHVRTHYCHKAVETSSQVAWLVKHYGMATTKPSKGSDSYAGNYHYSGGTTTGRVSGKVQHQSGTPKQSRLDIGPHPIRVEPMVSRGNIWGT